MRGAAPALVRWALCGLTTACGVADLDYTGKTCSAADACPSGWECIDNRCARASSTGGPACAPKVRPANFRVAWKTPNSIRWAWDPDRELDPAIFERYELRLGKGSAATADTNQTYTVWTATENAELGDYRLKYTGGDDHVAGTVTDRLIPQTSYWGQLVAYDNAGCAFVSSKVGASTAGEPAADRQIVLFDDDYQFGGYPNPPGAVDRVVNRERAYGGSAYLAYVPDCTCDASACSCPEVPKITGMSADISAIGPNMDKSAFLELAVATPDTSYWSGAVITLDPTDLDPEGANFEPYTLTGGPSYRLWQIPLFAFIKQSGTTVGPSDAGRVLSLVGVIGTWETGHEVRFDEVRIRW